jgi:hypothetical protein
MGNPQDQGGPFLRRTPGLLNLRNRTSPNASVSKVLIVFESLNFAARAITIISGLSPFNPVRFADGNLARLITFATPSRGPLAVRFRTSSPSRYAGSSSGAPPARG